MCSHNSSKVTFSPRVELIQCSKQDDRVCYDRLHAYYQDMVSLITLYLEFGSSGLYKLEHLLLWQFAECLGLGHFLEVLCNVFMTQHPNVSYLYACVKVHWKGQ